MFKRVISNFKFKLLIGSLLSLMLTFSSFSASAKDKNKPHVYHLCTKQDSTRNALACALYYEARGEGDLGMFYVGNVILNRKHHESYPSKVKKVIFQKHQFSYVSEKPLKVSEKKSWETALYVANLLLLLDKNKFIKRSCFDVTNGSIMYHKKGFRPKWAKSYKRVGSYKYHIFYKEKL